MSGHSKWHSIKHKKGALDAKCGKIFTRIIKELTVAARVGGGDPGMNPRLRTIVADAKAANMPNDNIARAIRRGTGEEPGVSYEEVTYEGYGPGGAAVIVETVTDNRNRTVGEIRHTFERYGGHLGASGSVHWMFRKRGLVHVPKDAATEDRMMEIVLDAGGEDVKDAGEFWEIETDPAALEAVKAAVAGAGITAAGAEVALVPGNRVHLEEGKAETMLKLMNALEDDDDVQNVYANFDIDDAVLERLTA